MFLLDYFYAAPAAPAQANPGPAATTEEEEWVWIDNHEEEARDLTRDLPIARSVDLLDNNTEEVSQVGAPPQQAEDVPPTTIIQLNNPNQVSSGKHNNNLRPNTNNFVQQRHDGMNKKIKSRQPTSTKRRSQYFKTQNSAGRRVNNDRKCGGRGF